MLVAKATQSCSFCCMFFGGKLVAMASCSTSPRLLRHSLLVVVVVAAVCVLGSSLAMTEPLAMALSTVKKPTGAKTREVVEHAVIFQLKPNVSDAVREDMVQSFADLKESSSKWVVAESAGLVLEPSQVGKSVGLFLRFFSRADLEEFSASEPSIATHKKYIPYVQDFTRISYVAKVEDNAEAVYRRGDAFASGAERIVGIKVKNDTTQADIDTMVQSLNDLNDVPEFDSLLLQITAGELPLGVKMGTIAV